MPIALGQHCGQSQNHIHLRDDCSVNVVLWVAVCELATIKATLAVRLAEEIHDRLEPKLRSTSKVYYHFVEVSLHPWTVIAKSDVAFSRIDDSLLLVG